MQQKIESAAEAAETAAADVRFRDRDKEEDEDEDCNKGGRDYRMN